MTLYYLLTSGLSSLGSWLLYALDRLRLNTQPWLDRLWRVAGAITVIGQIMADMFKQALIKCGRRLHHEEGYVKLFQEKSSHRMVQSLGLQVQLKQFKQFHMRNLVNW